MSIHEFCAEEMIRFAQANPQVQKEKDHEGRSEMISFIALQNCNYLDYLQDREDSFSLKPKNVSNPLRSSNPAF
jgi:hypothetical protein